MTDIYRKLHALVIDDFDNFRNTLSKMLQEFGVSTIDSASTGAEALKFCSVKTYDFILCDQNLGKGKTGQQILEELRDTENPNQNTLFILISAETNKHIIMAAYDYEPDAYLTKPITAQALEQRLTRLLIQRAELKPIYTALHEKQFDEVVTLCRQEMDKDTRYANSLQKILGSALLELKRLDEAETLYRSVLDSRQLDWAMLGMAQVKKLRGDSLGAQQWLEELIQFSPVCLKAYDVLADVLRERGDNKALQTVIKNAVEVSPLSILRQQSLGDVALKNNDPEVAAQAFRKAVKLGENSFHDKMDVHLNFANSVIDLAKVNPESARQLAKDALKSASELTEKFGKYNDFKLQTCLLESQLYKVADEDRKSREALAEAKKIMGDQYEAQPIDIKIQYVKALSSSGDQTKADQLLNQLLDEYSDSEADLQKIDTLLAEPKSEKNKSLVIKVNREGIAYYEAKDYERAIDAFNSALQALPQHVGLRLNLLQASIENYRHKPHINEFRKQTQAALDYVRPLIQSSQNQYKRFRQLEEVWQKLSSDNPVD